MIRPASVDDWAQIWPFFREIVEVGETYAYPAPEFEASRALWCEEPPAVVFVAVEGDVVVGTAKAGPNRPSRGAHVATASFMVDPAARGRGVGTALVEHVLAWARAEGYIAMQFNAVVETNPAVQLWERLGFNVIGTVPEAFDSRKHGLVGLRVMHRYL